MPAGSSASSSTRPAGPTNGSPARSSLSPGCSPTSIKSADAGPSPNTVCVAFLYRSQFVHPAASAASCSIVSATTARYPRGRYAMPRLEAVEVGGRLLGRDDVDEHAGAELEAGAGRD